MNNNFDNVWRGISVNNFPASYFYRYLNNNTITVVADANASNPQWGIKVSQCYSSLVNGNTVTNSTGTNTTMQGIYSLVNTNCGVQCNTVTSFPTEIEFGGTNSGMTWLKNNMGLAAQGMQISGITGKIGQQGSTTNPNDNFWAGSTWMSTNFNLYTYSATAAYSPICYRTGNFKPSNNSGNPPALAYGAANTLSLTSTPSSNACATVAARPSGTAWSPFKVALSTSLALNSIHYPKYADTSSQIDKILLYRDLDMDTTLRLTNTNLHSFYHADSAGADGFFARLEHKLVNGQISTAQSELTAFTPTGNIQSNYKAFYQIYIDYADTMLPDPDITSLGAMAELCPFLDGPIVFNARALYNIVTGNVVLYNDDGCESRGNSAARLMSSEIQRTVEVPQNFYQLFPNPATNELNILSNIEKEDITMLIIDAIGKQVFYESLNLENYHTAIKFNLINGIYFVTLINSEGQVFNKKLVVER